MIAEFRPAVRPLSLRKMMLGLGLLVLATRLAVADDPSVGFRIIVDDAIWSRQQSDSVFRSPGFGTLLDRVSAISGQDSPKSVLRSLLVEGAGVKEISLVYSFDDALKKRLAADVDKYGVVKQNALPGGSLPNEPYEFAGAKFTVNQIPVLLDPYGDTRNFHSNMEIVDSSAFWRKFSLQPLAVALCGTTPADAAYKMKLIANIRYGDAKLTVAQIAAISVQCTLSLTSPPVHQTRIQLRYANGEAPELTKCEALSCGEWISDN